MKKSFSINQIVAIGIGSAVFFILKKFVGIPTPIPNTELATAYPFLALMGVVFGPIVAGLIGLIGHYIADSVSYGPWWSWILTSGILGFLFGLIGYKIDIENEPFDKKKIIIFIVLETLANIVCWLLISPTLDVLIYSEPINKVFVQGLVTSISNSIITAIIGTILIKGYSLTRIKKGSLNKEKE